MTHQENNGYQWLPVYRQLAPVFMRCPLLHPTKPFPAKSHGGAPPTAGSMGCRASRVAMRVLCWMLSLCWLQMGFENYIIWIKLAGQIWSLSLATFHAVCSLSFSPSQLLWAFHHGILPTHGSEHIFVTPCQKETIVGKLTWNEARNVGRELCFLQHWQHGPVVPCHFPMKSLWIPALTAPTPTSPH